MQRICLMTVCLAALAFPASSMAAQVAPPGNSGVSEYRESIPSAGGNTPTSGGKHGNHGGAPLSRHAQRALRAQGPSGLAAARLAAATAPAGSPPADAKASQGHSTAGSSSGGSGPINVLKHAAGGSDDGGMGPALPLLLGGSAAGALLFTLRRRLS
jgi:hypothetical protein